MKQLISRRSFLKAAGVTTAVAAVSLGAPAASACYPGSFKDITILYTNDVHTYIDKKSPELTYAAIAALKKSYQDDIQIDAISLVYAMQYAGTDQLCAIPSWKVDYVLKNADENTQIKDPGSLWIDAVSGFVADYWKQD